MLELSINIVLNGLFYAGVLFLISAGLQIIFGVLRIVNFAHAGAYILGIYFTYAIIRTLPRNIPSCSGWLPSSQRFWLAFLA